MGRSLQRFLVVHGRVEGKRGQNWYEGGGGGEDQPRWQVTEAGEVIKRRRGQRRW